MEDIQDLALGAFQNITIQIHTYPSASVAWLQHSIIENMCIIRIECLRAINKILYFTELLFWEGCLKHIPNLKINPSNIMSHAYPYDAVCTLIDSSSPKHRLRPYKFEMLVLGLGQKVLSLVVLSNKPTNLEKHAAVRHHAVIFFPWRLCVAKFYLVSEKFWELW